MLLVWKIDRAFRSVIHAANTLGMLRGYRVSFRSYIEPSIDTTTPHGEFIFNIMAAVVALERQTISQRVRAGIKGLHPHSLRHLLATTWVGKGLDTKKLQVLLGHAHISTTMEYVDSSFGQLRSEYNKLWEIRDDETTETKG